MGDAYSMFLAVYFGAKNHDIVLRAQAKTWHEPDDFVTVYETKIKLTRFGDPVFVRWDK